MLGVIINGICLHHFFRTNRNESIALRKTEVMSRGCGYHKYTDKIDRWIYIRFGTIYVHQRISYNDLESSWLVGCYYTAI